MARWWNKVLLLGILTFVQVDRIHAQITTSRDVIIETQKQKTYKAAVFAHAAIIPNDTVPVSRSQALENMEANLKIFREQAEEAQRQGVRILVFPEDGIYGMLFNRETIYPYLEYMPDPSSNWNPCDEPNRYNDTSVQVSLSCMAKQNHLYIVANIGDKQPCDPNRDKKCPEDGRYQYNTDVAYGPYGTFLAKYHKRNLFFEDQFDVPEPQHVYFDTPFGRFGMMTCFDVLFREPGIPLVEQYNVTNIAFPTAWMDALPLFPAIGFHSSFARAHRINFLSANIHFPSRRFDGSGLYAPDGAYAFHYENRNSPSTSQLLVAMMDIIEKPPSQTMLHQDSVKVPKKSRGLDASPEKQFESKLFEDTYFFRTLDIPSGKLDICHKNLCCELEYIIEKDTFTGDELFAFGAFDGLHTHEGTYYMQNCALVKCADAKSKTSCGSPVFESTTIFTKVVIRGHFQTPYVYPQVVLSNSEGTLRLSPPGTWSFQGSVLETTASFQGNVLNAILLGRDYTRDTASVRGISSSLLVSLLVLISRLVTGKLIENQ